MSKDCKCTLTNALANCPNADAELIRNGPVVDTLRNVQEKSKQTDFRRYCAPEMSVLVRDVRFCIRAITKKVPRIACSWRKELRVILNVASNSRSCSNEPPRTLWTQWSLRTSTQKRRRQPRCRYGWSNREKSVISDS